MNADLAVAGLIALTCAALLVAAAVASIHQGSDGRGDDR